MNKKSPHLPPKLDILKKEGHYNVLKWTISVVALSILTGITASLVIFDWMFPLIASNTNSYFINRYSNQNFEIVQDSALVRETRYRLINIYNKAEADQFSVFSHKAKLGQAVFLSSDGWAVFYLSTMNNNLKKDIIGVDHNGIVYNVENMIFDKSGLVYIKFNGSGFRVTLFADWDNIKKGENLWSVNGKWKVVQINNFEKYESATNKIWDSLERYGLNDSFNEGNIVITNKGEFVGFVDKDGLLLEAWSVQYNLPNILSNSKLSSFGLDWQGHFIDGWIDSKTKVWKNSTGFYITNIKAKKDGLLPKDVVLEINNNPIEESSFVRQLHFAGEKFTATVLRKGELVEVDVLVEMKSP